LLASFVIEVDKAGELARGNAAVDALKSKLLELQLSAAPTAAAVKDVFQSASGSLNSFLAQQNARQLGGRADNGGWGAAGAAAATRNAAAATAQANAAATAYAGTLRGRLASAVEAVRAGFTGAGTGAKGPGLISTLGTVRNGLLALGVGAVIHGVKRLVDGIGDISEGAARLGVTTDEFQRMSTWARQNATDVDTLGTAFRTLATSAVDPTKETAAAFADLGVKTTDANGQFKTSQQLFFEVGEALAGVTNETVRTQLAQKLLGRSAIALKPMFAQGTEAFRQQREEMLKLKVLSPEVIAAADSLSDSWVALSSQLLATAGPVLKDVLFPALKKLTEFLVKGVEWLGKIAKTTDVLAAALTALGYVVWTRLIPRLVAMIALGPAASASLLSIAAAAAAAVAPFAILAGAFFVVRDLINFLTGQESVIGTVMDKLFGKGASTAIIEALGRSWGILASAVKSILADLGLLEKSQEDLKQEQEAKGAWENSNFNRKLLPALNAAFAGGGASPSDYTFRPGGSMPPPPASGGGASPPAAPNVSIGDSVVNITMSQSATAKDVGAEVSSVQASGRDAVLASYSQ
jgi:hypothetical protein